MLMLAKVMQYCDRWPETTALIVRKEFTDLKDSTIRDFQKYYEVTVGSDKDFVLANGSKIMFRHAGEIEVLKNINLGCAAIEQAEEFSDETQFMFIRDRLRQQNGADLRPLIIIANACGHNWIWKMWINNPQSAEYDAITANTFENMHNLPDDFVADLRRMEKEAPHHYAQYIMNSFEETEEDDFLFKLEELESARKCEFSVREGYGLRLAGFDVARYGQDKCACVCIQQMGALVWQVCHVEQWEKKDLDYTTGRILSTAFELRSEENIIDEDGIGAGPLDVINKGRGYQYTGFRNRPLSYQENQFFGNPRTENAFKLKEMIVKGHLSMPYQELIEQLLTLKFKFMDDGRRVLVSKEKMRLDGLKSPDLADALIMAVSLIGPKKMEQDRQYFRQPVYSKEESLFKVGGIR
jgi:hypothetical protein